MSHSAVRQLLQPQPLVVSRRVAPPAHHVARHAAHHPAVEQHLHGGSTSCSPSCPASDTGPRAGGVPALAKKGLRRSTLTVGLQRILRGSACRNCFDIKMIQSQPLRSFQAHYLFHIFNFQDFGLRTT